MRLAAVLVMLVLALAGCGASGDEMAAAVQEAEQPLTEQLAESERQNLLLQREVGVAEAAAERAREQAAAAAEKAKVEAEQALATQTAAVQAKEAQVLA